MTAPARGKVRDLALHLLDRQVLDPDGRPVGKVDDVELVVPEDGGAPYVSALLCGPQGLAPRLGGLLGSWLAHWSRVLGPQGPGRIGMELLTDIGSSLRVARTRAELGVEAGEDVVREYLVDRIPGARRARQ